MPVRSIPVRPPVACWLAAGLIVATAQAGDEPKPDPLAAWRTARVAPVSGSDRHSIHAYFNTSPESPDGSRVLFYASTAADGHTGELRVRDRASGKETVVATNVAVEDAHRAACQQWVSGGKRVAFHNVLNDSEWVVAAVDLDESRERVLARGRQLGFGQPGGDRVPLYGPHWNPGSHRGLEFLNVATGEIEPTALQADVVEKAEPDWIARQFGGKPVSVFFPLLSPDGDRVLFKLAAPAGGDFRSKSASVREGVFCFDLAQGKILFHQERWGHPAWHSNSRDVLNVGGRVTDSQTAKVRQLPGRWHFPGSHPSYSPDGRLFTTDVLADASPWNAQKGTWAVVVGNVETGEFVTLREFDNSKGARSWRVSHPHPVFSPDGRRIYFNVSDGPWTRLHVAGTTPGAGESSRTGP